MARLNLNITIESLERGQHVECKSLEELLGAEDAILTACKNLKAYLDKAATFDGRELLFDFATGEPEPVAWTVSPSPAPIIEGAPKALTAPSSEMPQLSSAVVEAHGNGGRDSISAESGSSEAGQIYEVIPAGRYGEGDELGRMLMIVVGILAAVFVIMTVVPGPLNIGLIILAVLGFVGQKIARARN